MVPHKGGFCRDNGSALLEYWLVAKDYVGQASKLQQL